MRAPRNICLRLHQFPIRRNVNIEITSHFFLMWTVSTLLSSFMDQLVKAMLDVHIRWTFQIKYCFIKTKQKFVTIIFVLFFSIFLFCFILFFYWRNLMITEWNISTIKNIPIWMEWVKKKLPRNWQNEYIPLLLKTNSANWLHDHAHNVLMWYE